MEREELPDSTLAEVRDHPRGRGGRVAHRGAILVMVALVATGLLGVFGPRTGEAVADGDGYSLRVEHPAVTRAGHPAPLRLTVTRAGGFEGPVTVSLCERWFDDLAEAARQQGVRRFSDVELAVLEASGAFSFFTRQDDGSDT